MQVTEAELNDAIDDYATGTRGEQSIPDRLHEIAERLSMASQHYPAERISETTGQNLQHQFGAA